MTNEKMLADIMDFVDTEAEKRVSELLKEGKLRRKSDPKRSDKGGQNVVGEKP